MDALDTLYIMEMFEEFDAATDWVEKSLDFNVVSCVCALVMVRYIATIKYWILYFFVQVNIIVDFLEYMI